MSFYKNNLDTLTKQFPNFKAYTPELTLENSDFIISKSKSGLPTAKVKGKFIHSNREPAREAERLVKSELPDKISSCVIEGFGLGYFIEAIMQLRPELPLVIVEPSEERFFKSLEIRDFTKIFTSPQVNLLLGQRSEYIREILPGLPRGNIQIFKHRALYELDREYYLEVDRYIQHFLSRKAVNSATLKKFGKLWVRNLINNLNYLPEAGDVGDLISTYKDYPVLLLAAGPSLDRILPLLPDLYKRFVIVAVDTSAGVLINAGYNPDFTVIVDPQYWNTRHLDRVDLSKTILISESSTHPGIFRKNHEKLFYCGSIFPLGVFIEKYAGSKKKLAAGGSVATTAWDFCRLISRGELYSGGLDLGFPEYKTHFHGSFFEEKVHTETSRIKPSEDFGYQYLLSGDSFKSPNNTGSTTLTDQRLSIYIHWFEEQIEVNKIKKIWNLSALGIKIKGMDYKELDSLLSYPEIRESINKISMKIRKKSTTEIVKTRNLLIQGIRILKTELERLLSLSNDALSYISEYKNSKQNKTLIPNLIKNLDRIDLQIMSSSSNRISSFLLQPIITEITEMDQADTFDEGIGKSEKLYSRIKESSKYHNSLIDAYLKNHNNLF